MKAGYRNLVILTRLFLTSCFRLGILDDAGEESFKRGILGLLAGICAGGLLLARIYMTKYQTLRAQPTSDFYWRALPADQLLMIALSMLVVALGLALVAHSLFPDESDFRILMALPLSRGLIFAAKLSALFCFSALFIAITVVAIHLPFTLISTAPWSQPFVRRALAQTAGLFASTFAGLAIVAVQGVVTVGAPSHWRRTAAVAAQTMTICALVLCFPVVTRTPALADAIHAQSQSLYLAPPVWFLGVEQWLLGRADDFFERVATIAVGATFGLGLLTAACYGTIYRRFDRLILRPHVQVKPAAWNTPIRLPIRRPPAYRAVQGFVNATVRRSGWHQLVLWGTFSVGSALAVNSLLGSVGASPRWLIQAALATPLSLMAAAIVGLRGAFLVPANLRAAWVLKLTETREARPHQLDAVHHTLFAVGVALPAALTFPIQAAVVGIGNALACVPAILACGWVVVELAMLNWRRIPFTCTLLFAKRPLAHSVVAAVLSFNALMLFGTIFQQLAMSGGRSQQIGIGVLLLVGSGVSWVRRRTWGRLPFEFEDALPDALETLRLR